MRRYLFPIIVAVLVILNVVLLWQNHNLKSGVSASSEEPTYLAKIGGVTVDLRGLYTYPGFGTFFVPQDADGQPVRAPLTLVIFFSSATGCPATLSETEVYQRLLPVFRERGQAVVAVTSDEDSSAIAEFLEQEKLDLTVMAMSPDSSESGLQNFAQMGISPRLMPFKILYDSTLTAIYMRGADNTPESQADFEAAMLWLSEIVANRQG